MTRTAFYAGSFDPPTNGHVAIIRSATRLFDRLVIGIGVHPSKTPLFPPEERIQMLNEIAQSIEKESECSVEIITFDDLTISQVRSAGANVLLRGIRDGSDLDYEMQIAGMNEAMAPDIQTVFLPAAVGVRPITATLVRQVASMGGDVSSFVPSHVAERLARKFSASS